MSNNTIEISGRLGFDPEIGTTPNGKTFAKFSLPVSEEYPKGKWTTVYLRVKAWNATADFVSKNLHKGDEIRVRGALKPEQWVDSKTGLERKEVSIVAFEVEHMGNAKREQAESDAHGQQQAPSKAQADAWDDESIPF